MKERFAKPVAWLFGPELIVSLKAVILHTLYRGFDVRDWMHPEVLDAAALPPAREGDDAFWFDFLADTGDGFLETYSVAALSLAELGVPALERGARVTLGVPATGVALPRGSFLLVGGDTAYHVANRATLKGRFQQPFTRAFEDLEKRGRLAEPKQRPLVGIPGNHDYYDMLDGFNRQFRRPARAAGDRKPELHIPAFRREQEASYLAVRLPHDWWLLAIDTEKDGIDFRQKAFFQSIVDGTHPDVVAAGKGPPKKLVVVTPSPTTVFGRRPKKTEALVKTFADLGLRTPFAAGAGADDRLRDGECRVDLSGDIHHYARYWGPDGAGTGPTDPSYASVVSGLGGAFHHPSGTRHGPLEPRGLYPDADTSRREVGRRIFHPWTVMSGGYVSLVTALVAALFYTAFAHRYSIRWMADRVLTLVPWLNVTPPEGDIHLAAPGLIVFLAIVVAFVLGWCAWWYSGEIYKRSKKEDRVASPFAYAGPIALLIAAFAAPCVAVLLVEKSQAGSVAFDIVFYVALILLVPGVPWFAGWVGAKDLPRARALFVGIGVWHLAMHALPVALLVKVGSWAAVGATLAAWTIFWIAGRAVATAERARPYLMLVLWIAFGLVLLAIPILLPRHEIVSPESRLVKTLWVFVAGGAGLVFGCLQFSWYLMVCHGFHGHNNEVGGAARIGFFKQFLRIKVEPERLTVHTIAVDHPGVDAERLDARLVDVFAVTPARE